MPLKRGGLGLPLSSSSLVLSLSGLSHDTAPVYSERGQEGERQATAVTSLIPPHLMSADQRLMPGLPLSSHP